MLSRGEELLRMFIKRCFPNYKQEYNVRSLGIINPVTKAQLELDIYIPELKIGFEFNGRQHRTDREQAKRDLEKTKQCKQKGIKLIKVWTLTLTNDFYSFLNSKIDEDVMTKPTKKFLNYFQKEADEYKKNIYKMNSKIKSNTFVKVRKCKK